MEYLENEKKFYEDIKEYLKLNKPFEEIIKDDFRFSIYYNLSEIRENILSWYPFDKSKELLEIGSEMGAISSMLASKVKKITCFEPDANKNEILKIRLKKTSNTSIINSINSIKDKYDYIIFLNISIFLEENIIGKTLTEIIENLKKMLKKDGKIIIAVDNKISVKKLCGNNIVSQTKTCYSKKEIVDILENLKLKYNFYYPFPDYKFPQIIVTENFITNNYDMKYTPYYEKNQNLINSEIDLFKNFIELGVFNVFSNSLLIEISNNELTNDIEYVKFQNVYRKKEYQLATIVKKNEVIKYSQNKKSIQFLEEMYSNHKKLNQKYKMKKNGNRIIFEKLNYTKMIDLIYKEQQNIIKYLDIIEKKIYESSDIEYSKNNIFNKYGIKITPEQEKKLHFLKKGYLDMTFFNAFLNKEKIIFIDQEWAFDYLPAEYIMYRNILLLKTNDYNNVIDDNYLYAKYNIDKKLFDKLEEKLNNKIFLNDISNPFFNNYKIVDLKELTTKNYELENLYKDKANECLLILSESNEIKEKYNIINDQLNLEQERNKKLNNQLNLERAKNNDLKNHIEKIYNSKTWKIIVFIKKYLLLKK